MPTSQTPEKILVVEDSADFQLLIKEALGPRSYWFTLKSGV